MLVDACTLTPAVVEMWVLYIRLGGYCTFGWEGLYIRLRCRGRERHRARS